MENEADELDEHDEALMGRKVENLLAQFKRRAELQRETDIRVDLGTAAALRNRFCRLTEKRGVAALLDSYRQLDELLEVLETTVAWASESWDRSAQQAVP